jgi:hypothetical protein
VLQLQKVQVRDADKHPVMQRILSMIKNYLSPNINYAKVKNHGLK